MYDPTVGVRLPKKEKDAFWSKAKADGVSPSSVVRAAIKTYLSTPGPAKG
jgi:hypothetical protein